MKEISFEESKSIMLKMMKDIDAFCRKEGIHYSLADGTLIGAIRHKGMIPWDDDVDLCMTRDNYEKFKATYKSDKYCLQNYDYKYNSWFMIIKIVDPKTIVRNNETGFEPHGIWVTIYPIDNAPDNESDAKLMYHNIKRYQKLFRTRNFYWIKQRGLMKNLLMYCLHLVLLPYSKDYWHNKAETEITKYRNIKTNRRGNFVYWMENYYMCSSAVFDEYIDAEFEGENFMIIKRYDEYLRCIYGDYMKLPPENERIPKHDYTAYYI